ncbi:MAG: FtsX-like permease family protein [Candidatus Omnitrophota bacterium]
MNSATLGAGFGCVSIATATAATALMADMTARVRDLALLRVLGAQPRELAAIALTEAILCALVAAGLGLALAKNIVEAHYGRLWVSSEVGSGTSFHFTIPFTHKPRESRKAKKPEGTE